MRTSIQKSRTSISAVDDSKKQKQSWEEASRQQTLRLLSDLRNVTAARARLKQQDKTNNGRTGGE